MGEVSIGLCIVLVVAAAAAGFGGCLAWRRAREQAQEEEHTRELAAKQEELERAEVAHEQALEAKDAELAEHAGEVEERDARITALETDLAAAESALEEARVTEELDQFSDFQLLGMCDVYDAELEDESGSLRRPYGDPAMEQLMNLGIVTFEMPRDAEGRDKGGHEKIPYWNLKPMWRRFTKLRRAEMDERTEELRARRDARRGR